MSIQRPYRRTCRQFTNGSYADSGKSRYIDHPLYARSPEHYVRAFFLLLKDVQELFDYVEPSDVNLPCFSYRIHELLLRICVEIEANCKAILSENGYTRSGDWKMTDYRKIEASHRLSRYLVKLPFWQGANSMRTPFAAWASRGSLPWYQAYNTTKHDRHNAFSQATFQHMTDAFAGLLALLSSQFYTHDFSPGDVLLACEGPGDGMEAGIGGYLRVRFPDDWQAPDRYDFDWDSIKSDSDPFQQYDYTQVA